MARSKEASTTREISAPHVVLVHGFVDSGAVWQDVIDNLAGSGREFTAVDLAGMGSRADAEGPFTLRRFATDVRRLIEDIDRPVVLIGHSMGAQVAELVAEDTGERVVGLVLLTPIPLAGTHLPAEVISTFAGLGGQPDAQRGVRAQLTADLEVDALERLSLVGDQVRPDVVTALAHAWNDGDPAGGSPSSYRGPVLIIAGAQDGFVTPEVLGVVQSRFDDPQHERIEGAGHWPHAEKAEAVSEVVDRFLSALSDSTHSAWPRPAADWAKAFESKSDSAFAETFAPDVTLEASVLAIPIQGRPAVKTVMGAASRIYQSLVFTAEVHHGSKSYMEWQATAFGGVVLDGVTILTRNDDGLITRVAIHHRPLGAALRFSEALREALDDAIPAAHFYSVPILEQAK